MRLRTVQDRCKFCHNPVPVDTVLICPFCHVDNRVYKAEHYKSKAVLCLTTLVFGSIGLHHLYLGNKKKFLKYIMLAPIIPTVTTLLSLIDLAGYLLASPEETRKLLRYKK